jgi:predicted amino acid racemase
VFLELLKRRNPELLEAAATLSVERRLPPNTFVLDLETIEANAAAIRARADALGLRMYFMTKQIGRNPLVTAAMATGPDPETVAVDIACADSLANHGIRLGHVGNLVQTSVMDLPRVIAMGPEVMTVFSSEKAAQVAEVARAAGVEQGLLLRVSDPANDVYLPGMEGGIPLGDLEARAREIQAMPGVRIDGVTTFPALAYDTSAQPRATPNFHTLIKAAEILQGLGVDVRQINAPGNTSVHTLDLQASLGATHVEPGHGFLGTTPFHLNSDLVERPAACYVSEVAHRVGDRAYIYGGGFFIDDPVWLEPGFTHRAMVGSSVSEMLEHEAEFLGAGSGTAGGFGGIDYYGYLDDPKSQLPVGASVVMGFRIQSFVTRANIAVVTTSGGAPHLHGVFDNFGNRLPQYG